MFSFVSRLWIFVILSMIVLGFGFGVSCSPPAPSGEQNVHQEGAITPDGGNQPEGTTPRDDTTNGKSWIPAGYAAVEIIVDDSANKTYRNGDLLWNGSFVYDKNTRKITYSSAWQPTDGPFPPLYDDGAVNEDGHEPVGSVKGDHIFGTVVFVKPDPAKDLEFEYGVINEENHWLWEGANGSFTIKPGDAGKVIRSPGMTIPKHGNIDIKITLNTQKLPEQFAVDPANMPIIFIKGTMTNWGHVQIIDNGKKGDDQSGDSIVTFVQSHNTDYSPHFGLLQYERHMQFVFQFTSIDGREYKDADDNAIKDGVEAWADCNGDGKFTDDEKHEIIWEKDSRGAVKNTTIIVCQGRTAPCGSTPASCKEDRCKDHPACKENSGCKNDGDCKANEKCDTASGKCVSKSPNCTKDDCLKPECQNEPICQCKSNADCPSGKQCNIATGQCIDAVKCSSDADCPAEHSCTNGSCVIKPCTVNDCNKERCRHDPVCPCSQRGPVIYYVKPNVGSMAGGDTITILGENLQQGIKVEFDGNEASNINITSPQELTCVTPPGSKQTPVEVKLTNTDGCSSTFPDAFTYGGTAPSPLDVVPNYGLKQGGNTVTIIGRGTSFANNTTVTFGNSPATNVQVKSATEIQVTTPAHNPGKFDVKITSDGKTYTIPGGFTFTDAALDAVEWCNIQWPNSIPDPNNNIPAAAVGQNSPEIYGWVYHTGITNSPGRGQGITTHVGIGPVGSDPATDSNWRWFVATYFADKAGLGGPHDNDEYKGTVIAPSAGNYDYAYRFSKDGINFKYCNIDGNTSSQPYSSAKAGKLTAQ